MNSRTSARFRRAFAELPPEVQQQAREAYALFRQNPYHPSLHFKQIHAVQEIFSVRISRNYRALGVRSGEDIVWFWIGSHAGYDQLLKRL